MNLLMSYHVTIWSGALKKTLVKKMLYVYHVKKEEEKTNYFGHEELNLWLSYENKIKFRGDMKTKNVW